MRTIMWQPKAVRQLEKINDNKLTIKILSAIDGLTDLSNCGNVKVLKNHKYKFRLRVGRFRIFFNVQDIIQIIYIEEIKKRDEQTY